MRRSETKKKRKEAGGTGILEHEPKHQSILMRYSNSALSLQTGHKKQRTNSNVTNVTTSHLNQQYAPIVNTSNSRKGRMLKSQVNTTVKNKSGGGNARSPDLFKIIEFRTNELSSKGGGKLGLRGSRAYSQIERLGQLGIISPPLEPESQPHSHVHQRTTINLNLTGIPMMNATTTNITQPAPPKISPEVAQSLTHERIFPNYSSLPYGGTVDVGGEEGRKGMSAASNINTGNTGSNGNMNVGISNPSGRFKRLVHGQHKRVESEGNVVNIASTSKLLNHNHKQLGGSEIAVLGKGKTQNIQQNLKHNFNSLSQRIIGFSGGKLQLPLQTIDNSAPNTIPNSSDISLTGHQELKQHMMSRSTSGKSSTPPLLPRYPENTSTNPNVNSNREPESNPPHRITDQSGGIPEKQSPTEKEDNHGSPKRNNNLGNGSPEERSQERLHGQHSRMITTGRGGAGFALGRGRGDQSPTNAKPILIDTRKNIGVLAKSTSQEGGIYNIHNISNPKYLHLNTTGYPTEHSECPDENREEPVGNTQLIQFIHNIRDIRQQTHHPELRVSNILNLFLTETWKLCPELEGICQETYTQINSPKYKKEGTKYHEELLILNKQNVSLVKEKSDLEEKYLYSLQKLEEFNRKLQSEMKTGINLRSINEDLKENIYKLKEEKKEMNGIRSRVELFYRQNIKLGKYCRNIEKELADMKEREIKLVQLMRVRGVEKKIIHSRSPEEAARRMERRCRGKTNNNNNNKLRFIRSGLWGSGSGSGSVSVSGQLKKGVGISTSLPTSPIHSQDQIKITAVPVTNNTNTKGLNANTTNTTNTITNTTNPTPTPKPPQMFSLPSPSGDIRMHKLDLERITRKPEFGPIYIPSGNPQYSPTNSDGGSKSKQDTSFEGGPLMLMGGDSPGDSIHNMSMGVGMGMGMDKGMGNHQNLLPLDVYVNRGKTMNFLLEGGGDIGGMADMGDMGDIGDIGGVGDIGDIGDTESADIPHIEGVGNAEDDLELKEEVKDLYMEQGNPHIKDFHQEFCDHADDFSPSWRTALNKKY